MAATLRTLRFIALGLSLLGSLLVADQAAVAQTQQAGTTSTYRASRSATPAMQYFGHRLRTPMAQPPSRRQAPATPQVQQPAGKPFHNVTNGPTISPYLNLDAVETSVGLPNYYSRVLPQIQQQEANQKQAVELRRLQQQVRLANAPGTVSNHRNVGVPTTGRSSQFMNSGSYFPTIQR